MGDITGLGERWTHWTLAEKLESTLVTIDGNPINAGSIVNTFLLIAMLYAAWRYSLEQSQRQNELEQEYRSAQELQRVLIPESMPTLPGYVVKGAYRPAQEVGGDFFQVIPICDDSAIVVIGDVSGKGLHAAMTVSLIVGAIRSTVEMTEEPAGILSAINRRLHGRLQRGFATCLVLKLERDGACVMANAGHLPPYLNAAEIQSPPALPLGIVSEAEYDEVRFRLTEIDRITLYTDGLLEARNPDGELFGFARIAEMLANTGDAEKIADAAQNFGQDDDITVLTIAMAMAPAEVAVKSAQWGGAASVASAL
jgi:serine phosphatase RsbU (regulator of sigma subunit)